MKARCCIASFLIIASLCWSAQAAKIAPPKKRDTYVEGEILVKFAPGRSETLKGKTHASAGAKLKRRFDFIGWQQVDLPPGMTVEAAIEFYKKQPGVLDAAANEVCKVEASEKLPDDPALSGAGDLLWSMKKISAPGAWVGSTGSSDIVVAVVDTGIDYNHPDLAANIWRNPGEIAGNGIDDDGNGFVDDVVGYDFGDGDSDPMDGEGHGTHVAGIIGAVGNNAVGVTGVNWNVKLMPVKVMTGNTRNGTTATAIAGLEYIATMIDRGVNVKVANHSYAFALANSAPYFDAMSALTLNDRNVLNVCAAGNGGADSIGDDNAAIPVFPANLNIPSLISVAATDVNDQLTAFSNFSGTLVHLAAPGDQIYSTSPTGLASNPNYQILDGTSMAAPHVAGAAALILASRPVLTPMQVKAALLETVDLLPQLQGKVATSGRLNVRRAMWSYDQGDPEVEIDSEFSGDRHSLVELHGFAREYYSEIAEVRIRLQHGGKFWTGSTWKTTNANDPEVQLITTLTDDGSTTWVWSYTQLPVGADLTDGSFVVTAISEDLPGYTATTSQSFSLDRVLPTLTLASLGTGPITSPLLGDWIGGTADDNNLPPTLTARIIRMSDGFYWNGQQWTSALALLPCSFYNGNQWKVDVPLPEDLEVADGQYTVAITATDSAGNTTDAESLITVNVNRVYGDTTGNPTAFDIAQQGRPTLTLPSRNPSPALTYTLGDSSRIFSTEFLIPAPNGGYYSGLNSTNLDGVSVPGCVLMRHDANGNEIWHRARERRLLTVVGGSQNVAEERWSDTHSWYTLEFENVLQHDFGTTRLDGMVTDAAGNLYVGLIYGFGYYGDGPFCVIIKFNPAGDMLWRKAVDGSGFARIKGMELLSDNSVAVLLASTNAETPTLARIGSVNDFSKRLTADGTASRALFMSVDASDGIHVVSEEAAGVPKPAEDSTGYAHVLRKLDATGNVTRTVSLAASKAPERWTAIRMHKASGAIYTAGSMILPGDSYGRVAVSLFDLSHTAGGAEQLWRCYAPYPSTTDQSYRGESGGVVQMDCNATGVVLASVSTRLPSTARTGCITKFGPDGVMKWSRHSLSGDMGFNEVHMPRALNMDAAGNVYVGSFHNASNVLAKIAANGDVQFVRTLGDGFGNLQVSPVPMLFLPDAGNPTSIGMVMKNENQSQSNRSGLYFFSNPANQPVTIELEVPGKTEIWVNAGDSFQLGRVNAAGTKPINFQWKFSNSSNWQDVPGAQDSLLEITNASAAAHSGYYYLEAKNVVGTQNTSTLKVWVTSPVSLPTALDAPALPWTTDGGIPWAGQAGGDSRDGTDSAMIVATQGGQSGSLRSEVTGPGTLSFMWFQTNEYYADFELFIDGVQVKKHNYLQYLTQEVSIGDGTHDLEWRFTSVNTSDPAYYPIRAFVDKVSFSNGEVPQVSISATDPSAAEPVGNVSATNTGKFRITRTGNTGSALTVKYTTIGGTGKSTLGSDFTLSATTPGNATIPAGASFVDITLTPKYDLLFEGTETATIQLVSDAGYSVVSGGSSSVSIADTLQKLYIYGRVVDGSGQGIANVKVSRSPGSGSVLTNSQGYYCFMGLGSGTYVITPSKSGLTFINPNLSVSVSTINATNQDFIGLTGRTIQGQLFDGDGVPLQGAQVIIKKGSTTVATLPVNAKGFYGLSNVAAGTYSVTPVRKGTKFFPSSLTGVVTNKAGWEADQFLGLSSPYIQGFIGDSKGKPLANVTVKAGSRSVTSNALGFYGFSVLPAGSYTIQPKASGRVFKPVSIKTSVTAKKSSGNNNFKE